MKNRPSDNVPLFDPDFEKLLKDDPNGIGRFKRTNNGNGDSSFLYGNTQRNALSQCQKRKPLTNVKNGQKGASRQQVHVPAEMNHPMSARIRNRNIGVSSNEQKNIHNFCVSVGTEVINSPQQRKNAQKTDIEIQTEPFEVFGGPSDFSSSFGQTDAFSASSTIRSASSISLNTSKISFNNGGTVIELENNDEVDFLVSSGQDFIIFDHPPSEAELESLKKLPTTVGFYLANSPEMLQKLLKGSNSSVFYSSKFKKSKCIGTDLTKVTEETLSFSGENIPFGSKINDKELQKLVDRGVNFFLLREGSQDVAKFSSTETQTPFYIASNDDQISNFGVFTDRGVFFNGSDKKATEITGDIEEMIKAANNKELTKNSSEEEKTKSTKDIKEDECEIAAEGGKTNSETHTENATKENQEAENLGNQTQTQKDENSVIQTEAENKDSESVNKEGTNQKDSESVNKEGTHQKDSESVNKEETHQKDNESVNKEETKAEYEEESLVNEFEGVRRGSRIKNQNDLEEVLNMGKNVFFYDHELTPEEIKAIDDLPNDFEYFIVDDKDVQKLINNGKEFNSPVLLFRNADKHIEPIGDIKQQTKMFKVINSICREPLALLNDEKRKFGPFKFGSMIESEEDLKKLAKMEKSFFVFDRIPSVDEQKDLKDLPNGIGYFVVPKSSLISAVVPDYEKKSETNFYREYDNTVIPFNGNNFSKDKVSHFLDVNDMDIVDKRSKCGGIQFNTLIRDEEQFNDIIDANGDFFLLDHVPNIKEKEILASAPINLPYFVCFNKSCLTKLGTDLKNALFYNSATKEAQNIGEGQTFKSFVDSKTHDEVNETRTADGHIYGEKITEEEAMKLLEENKNLILFKDEITNGEKKLLQQIPENVAYFICDSPTLGAESRISFYRAPDMRLMKIGEEMNERELQKFLKENILPDYVNNETKEINGIKCGSILKTEEELKAVMDSDNSFFVLDHIPNEEELEILSQLPENIGYFIVTKPDLLALVQPDPNSPIPISFYSQRNGKMNFAKELTKDAVDDFLTIENYNSKKEESADFSTTFKQSHLQEMMGSGHSFFMLNRVPTEEELQILEDLPVGVSYLVEENGDGQVTYFDGAESAFVDFNCAFKPDQIRKFLDQRATDVDERKLFDINYGTKINSDIIDDLITKGASFYLISSPLTKEEVLAFNDLPEGVGYFIVDPETIDMICPDCSDSTATFYAADYNAFYPFNGSFNEVSINEFTNECMTGVFARDTVIDSEEDVLNAIDNGENFFFISPETDKEEFSDVKHGILSDPNLLRAITLSFEPVEGKPTFFRGSDGTLHVYNGEIESEAIKNYVAMMERLKFGATIETEEELNAILDEDVDFFVLKDDLTAEQAECMNLIPDGVSCYVIKSDELRAKLYSKNPSAEMLYYDSLVHKAQEIDTIAIPPSPRMTTTISSLETREIAGVTYGSVIDSIDTLHDLIDANKSFIILDHKPTKEEREIFRDLPFETGFFVCTDPEILKELDENFEFNESGLAFYNANDHKVTQFEGRVDETSLNDFIDAIMDDGRYEESKDSRELNGVQYGDLLTRPSQLQNLLSSGKDFFLFSHSLSQEEFETLPEDYPYFVYSSNEVLSSIQEGFVPTTGITFYSAEKNQLFDFDGPLTEETVVPFLEALYNNSKSGPIMPKAPMSPIKNPRFGKKTENEEQVEEDNNADYEEDNNREQQLAYEEDNKDNGEPPLDYEEDNKEAPLDYEEDNNAEPPLDYEEDNEEPPLDYEEDNKDNGEPPLDYEEDNNDDLDKKKEEGLFESDDDDEEEEDNSNVFVAANKKVKDESRKEKDADENEEEEREGPPLSCLELGEENDFGREENEPIKLKIGQFEDPEIVDEPEIEEKSAPEQNKFNMSMHDLAIEANMLFEQVCGKTDEEKEEDINLEEIAESLDECMIDPEGIMNILSSDDDEGEELEVASNEDDEEDDEVDPFANFSDSVSSCFKGDSLNDGEYAVDSSSSVNSTSSKKRSKIPIHKKHKNSYQLEEDLSTLSEISEATTTDPEDKELNEVLEEEILGQAEIPEDAPRDVFGFPTTKPEKLPRFKAPKSLMQLWRTVRKRYINLSKKGHSAYPATNSRPEAIKKLIEKNRALHEYVFIEKRIRALTRVNVQLRSQPEAGYTTIYRAREGRRLMLALRTAQKRINILRKATELDDYGRSAYTIESEVEAQRVKMLVRLSKKKKVVSNIASDISALQQQVSDIDKRIHLMTQKRSVYTKFFKKPKQVIEEPERESKTDVEDSNPDLSHHENSAPPMSPIPPSEPRSARSHHSRIPVPQNN